jgi:hypothetical protein
VNIWIYLVVAGIIAVIWSFVLPSQPSKSKQGTSLDDLEESLNSFTSGLEEDNKDLNARLQSMKIDHEIQKSELLMRIDYLERKSNQIEEDTRRVARTVEDEIIHHTRTGGRPTDGPIGTAPEPEPEEQSPQTMVERYPELFELYKEGKSIEFIAKKVGKNKGEVILIIDLAKQGEEI